MLFKNKTKNVSQSIIVECIYMHQLANHVLSNDKSQLTSHILASEKYYTRIKTDQLAYDNRKRRIKETLT
jgi:hypothetical protein